jgi:hypothetical protein
MSPLQAANFAQGGKHKLWQLRYAFFKSKSATPYRFGREVRGVCRALLHKSSDGEG